MVSVGFVCVLCVYEVWEWRSEIVNISVTLLPKFKGNVWKIAPRVTLEAPKSLLVVPREGSEKQIGKKTRHPGKQSCNRLQNGTPNSQGWCYFS